MTDELFIEALSRLPNRAGTLETILLSAHSVNRDAALSLVVHDLVAAAQRLKAAGRIRTEFSRPITADVIVLLSPKS